MRRQEFLMCAGAHILNISFYPIPKLRRKPHLQFLRQYRIILSADTVSEVRQMLSQKRR